jgi:hypothetical protein
MEVLCRAGSRQALTFLVTPPSISQEILAILEALGISENTVVPWVKGESGYLPHPLSGRAVLSTPSQLITPKSERVTVFRQHPFLPIPPSGSGRSVCWRILIHCAWRLPETAYLHRAGGFDLVPAAGVIIPLLLSPQKEAFMRCFLHIVRGQVYINPHEELLWGWTVPNDPQMVSYRQVHLYTRGGPEHGLTWRKYGLLPVPFSLFARYLSEISFQEASRLDPSLVCFVTRHKDPVLPQLRRLLPSGARLYMVEVRRIRGGTLFDLYHSPEPGERGIQLTSALAAAHLLPTRKWDGRTLLLAPVAGKRGGTLLALALAARLWGERECMTYLFDMG